MHDARNGELIDALTTLIIRNDPERYLAEHRRTDLGTCSCSTPNDVQKFPCVIHTVAVQAQTLVLASRPRVTRAG